MTAGLTRGLAGGTVSGMTGETDIGGRDLPAGEAGTWLERTRAALRHEADAEVPGELLFAAPGLPAGHGVLPFDARGRCPLLDEGGRCTIYDHRPLTCRTYDCRRGRRGRGRRCGGGDRGGSMRPVRVGRLPR